MFFALSLIMSAMRVEEQSEEQQQVSTVGNENDGDESNELKKENIALQTKVQVLEKELVEEKKIHEKNIASLEEKYQTEIAEYKEKLTAQKEVLDSETVTTIHPMKVQLPLENWHDLLAFVPRSQLGNAVSEIGDYQFASIIQSFLHDEVRKITLGEMKILSPRPTVSSDRPMVHVWPNNATNMPESPMPNNVKDFKGITLNYLSTSVRDFLGYFQQNSLLTNVHMQFRHNHINEEVWPLILPFINSIDIGSIEFSGGMDLFEIVYSNTNDGISHESQLLLKEMMSKTRVLLAYWGPFTNWENKINWICSWLYTPKNDGKPRILQLHVSALYEPNNEYDSFIERIIQDFNEADHPVSFFISAIIRRNNIEDISIDNVKTNEKLVIETKGADADGFGQKFTLMVGRYPRKAAKKWIEANEKEIIEWDGEKLNRKMILTYV